jgi:flagellar motor protein MotB
MNFLKIILFIVVCFLHTVCPGQSGLIDSMKRDLHSANDTQKINSLNRISRASLNIQEDTALKYASEAFQEAYRIQDKEGMGDALLNEGKIKISRNNLPEAEKILLQAVSLFIACNNMDMAGSAYLNLGICLTGQHNFPAAIESYKKADWLFQQVKDSARSGYILTLEGLAYKANGNFEKAFEFWNLALMVRRKNSDHIGVLFSLSNMGILFEEVGDYQSAIDYFLQTVDYAKKNRIEWNPYNDKLSEAYAHLEQYDSALYYIRQTLESSNISLTPGNLQKTTNASTDVLIGHMFLIQKQYTKALEKLFQWKSNLRRMDVISYIGESYLGIGDYDKAVKYARKLLEMAQKDSSNSYVRDATTLLWEAYDQQKIYDSAYLYYRRYTVMRDSVSNYTFIRQMAAFAEASAIEKKELQNKKENEEKELLYKQKLDKESSIRKILIGSISGLLILGFILVTNISLRRKNENLERERLKNKLDIQQLENEKEQAKLQHRATDLEMEALRSQMNPHFIFNSLNSINRFILQNNKTAASAYLTKFSKLMRLILQNSQASQISLESELESLKLYLDLEALRFDYKFGYKISVAPSLDIDMLKIPPLIIQPYVENAIWHGLMPKEEKGQLDIEVSQENEHLYIKISDDGVGRRQSAAFGSKSATLHKSMGLRITADRIAMVQLSSMKESSVKINDMMNPDGTPAGTEVTIKIPVLYD